MKTKEKLITNQLFTFPISHSRHSRQRAIQRKITDDHIQEVLNYSEGIFKQGMIFHYVKTKLLPDNFDPSLRRKIERLVIIIAGDSDTIVTCYETDNPQKWIKKKACILQRLRMAS